MPHHLLALHWLWLFGALSLGIAVGWLAFRPATTPWGLARVAGAAAAACVLLVVARLVPVRYGIRIEAGVVLTVVGAIGCFVGWALRDLAEFTPSVTRPAPATSVGANGSYLFRDALAGMGAGPAYMRATTGGPSGGLARARPVPSAASLAQAPAPGGYTFPKTLPFADAPTSRPAVPTPGRRRHWSWPA